MQIYIFTIILGLQRLGVIQKSSKCTVNTSDPTYILVSHYNCELHFYITRGNAGFLNKALLLYVDEVWLCQAFEEV